MKIWLKVWHGYGKGEFVGTDRKYIVEIKSVNHKYIEFNFKLPKTLAVFEDNLRKLISNYVTRGKIEVNVRFENFSDIGKNIRFDDELIKQYLSEFDRVSNQFNIENDLKISNLVRIDGLMKFEQDNESNDIIQEELLQATKIAIDNFMQMREVEGNKIQNNLLEKLDQLKTNIDEIEKLSFNVVDEYKEKIESRLKDYIEEANIDNNRILTEIIIFADKMTIDEEIVRFNSHLNQFKKELSNDMAVGKKLDFIVQELNRETNTIGSKTNKLEISNLVILNKSILENIREQIQNIQ